MFLSRDTLDDRVSLLSIRSGDACVCDLIWLSQVKERWENNHNNTDRREISSMVPEDIVPHLFLRGMFRRWITVHQWHKNQRVDCRRDEFEVRFMRGLLPRTWTDLERGSHWSRTQFRTKGVACRNQRGEGEHAFVLVIVVTGWTIAETSDALTFLTAKFTFQFVDISIMIASRGKTSIGTQRRTIEWTISQHTIVREHTVSTALFPFDGICLQSSSSGILGESSLSMSSPGQSDALFEDRARIGIWLEIGFDIAIEISHIPLVIAVAQRQECLKRYGLFIIFRKRIFVLISFFRRVVGRWLFLYGDFFFWFNRFRLFTTLPVAQIRNMLEAIHLMQERERERERELGKAIERTLVFSLCIGYCDEASPVHQNICRGFQEVLTSPILIWPSLRSIDERYLQEEWTSEALCLLCSMWATGVSQDRRVNFYDRRLMSR